MGSTLPSSSCAGVNVCVDPTGDFPAWLIERSGKNSANEKSDWPKY